MELVEQIKRNDENIKKYINRISVKESMLAMNLSKEDYYTLVIL